MGCLIAPLLCYFIPEDEEVEVFPDRKCMDPISQQISFRVGEKGFSQTELAILSRLRVLIVLPFVDFLWVLLSPAALMMWEEGEVPGVNFLSKQSGDRRDLMMWIQTYCARFSPEDVVYLLNLCVQIWILGSLSAPSCVPATARIRSVSFSNGACSPIV